MKISLSNFVRLLVLLTGLLMNQEGWAGINLFVKSSIGPGEPLKIYLEAEFNTEKDLYVVLSKDSRFFSLTANGSVVSGIVPYKTARTFRGTVFDLTLHSIPREVQGKWLVIAAAVDHGQDPLSYRFDLSELQIKTLQVRQSSKRNIEYLSRFLERVRNDNRDYIYSLYGARLISVYHPELYLQADDLFLQFLFRIEGSSWFYDREPESIGPEEYLEKPGLPSFSMSMIDLSDYESGQDFEVYPESVPLLNWLDRRVAPLHFILKARKQFGLKLTHLEKAFLLYFYKKYAERKNASRLFIIYSLDGSAYVYDNGQIFDLENHSVSPNTVSKPIVLVFNESSVWFPLLERDDSATDLALDQALSLLAPVDGGFTPILSPFEKEAIRILKEKTRLDSIRQLNFAKHVAINGEAHLLHYGYNRLGIFPRTSSLPADAILNWHFYLRILSSALSPFSDYLAQALENAGYSEFSRRFLEFNQWGGETVSIDTASYTIDVGFRADVGTCKDLSVYAAAGLEAAGKYWVRIHGVIPNPNPSGSHLSRNYPHFYVYVPQDEAFIDNGRYGDGRAYGLKYVWGGVPGAAIPTLENFSIDILNTPEGFGLFMLAGSPPNYADSVNVYGSFPIDILLELLRDLYQGAQPKPLIPIYEPDYLYVISAISFEEGLNLIPRYYRQLHIP